MCLEIWARYVSDKQIHHGNWIAWTKYPNKIKEEHSSINDRTNYNIIEWSNNEILKTNFKSSLKNILLTQTT